MKGKVISFRRGRHTYKPRHFIIELGLDKLDREKASKYIDKEVVWKSPAGKVIKGKIHAAHGSRGLLRAVFEKGLPGQAINTEVEVKES